MSELIKSFMRYMRSSDNADIHIVSAEVTEDEHSSGSQLEIKRGKADIVEPNGRLDAKDVGAPKIGEFAYFLDGIERKHIPAYISSVPLVYGYVAAAVRMRDESRRMRTHSFEEDESFYLPFDMVDPTPLITKGMRVTDTKPEELILLKMQDYARSAIGDRRGAIERRLSRNWLRDFNGSDKWLLVDGSLIWTLGGNQNRYANPNIIGVIKSHPTQYFDAEGQSAIFALAEGERSGVFQPYTGNEKAPVYSWYLRLHSNAGKDLSFGLIRVDAPANDRTLDMADEISAWLLGERNPLALPDGRWDRMFYTIRDCEQYLRSRAPSQIMIKAQMI